MAQWSNWSGRLRAEPASIVSVQDESQVVEAIASARRNGQRVGVAGACHSHSPLVRTEGVLVDITGLAGVIAVDPEAGSARIRAGTRISELGEPLRARGVALINQGDIDRQSLGGALATGTHGTGARLRNLSAGLLGARIALGDGRVVECSPDQEPELFQATRLNLGGLGVVTELTVAVRPAYRLRERLWLEDLDAVLDRIEPLIHATRHFEFFWMPGSQRAACKAIEETEDAPVYPLAEEGKRVAWSDQVLANERPDKHSEMEYSVPREQGPACFRQLAEMLQRDFPELAWPLEYRSLAEDDVWLSTAYERPTATLSVHQGIDAPDEPVFRACEALFKEFAGRPHWGNVHYRSGGELADLHPRWADWWRVRDAWDPEDRFLGPHLESLREARD